jgi:hypothetical protein
MQPEEGIVQMPAAVLDQVDHRRAVERMLGIVERQRVDGVALQHGARISAQPAHGVLEAAQVTGLDLALSGNPVERASHAENEGVLQDRSSPSPPFERRRLRLSAPDTRSKRL